MATEVVTEAKPAFQNYTQLPKHIQIPMWWGIRIVTVTLMFVLIVVLFVKPNTGLYLFWKVIIPLLPLLFFIAPGVWRNLCPLAAANQTPRVLGFTRGLTAPKWLLDNAYIVSIVLFFGIAATRKVLFNTNGPALGIALFLSMLNGFVGGFTFKGKSGWCSSMCPLLPVQRLYGQTPFIVSPNGNCQPCVGCTKNCYDFNPKPAWQADMHDDADWTIRRKLFAAAFPGFVLGFLHPMPAHLSSVEIYLRLALFTGASIGSFFAVDAIFHISPSKLTVLYGAAAINIFYWYSSVILATSYKYYFKSSIHFVIWPIRGVVFALTLIWIYRTLRVEKLFVAQSAPPVPVKLTAKATEALKGEAKASGDGPEVQFVPDDHAAIAELGVSLLEVAEKDGKSIEAGCRMGICGADPIGVLEGMECLSPIENDEATTLRRLGLAATTRMACCALVQTAGKIKVSMTPEKGDASAAKPVEYDRSITSVVVLGNGIAGATAADYLRRGHPDCEIHVVGRESHVLYNRMGISRLIYGRSAMQGLYLLPEDWYDEHNITAWLNTAAADIDLQRRTVHLRTGDVLPWDRLILAMGSGSTVPSIDGYGRPGTFVVREASDAMAVRAYAQDHGAHQAVVAGAGLLGLEAAHALYELGLNVTVLDRGNRLLARQIDARCSALVYDYFRALGIQVLHGAETKALPGRGAIRTVELVDGRKLPCQIFVAAVGITPNADLARAAGVEVNRGVLVDDHMRTNVPNVYAAGDVAEHQGVITGLWPTAVKQAEVAATNALGGDMTVDFEPPITILKGVGLELTSAGRFEEEEGDSTIVLEDASQPSYRKLVMANGKVDGMIILGHHPEDITAATGAVKKNAEVHHSWLADLREGNWKVLKNEMPAAVAEYLGRPEDHPFRPDPTTPRACRDCGYPMSAHVTQR
jgi:NADPH-dependent 2,4-dienoyl-CoA reductase/sulfur reductase-like enzyme/ferredoxin